MYYSLYKSCDCISYRYSYYYKSKYDFMYKLLLMRLVTFKFKYNKFIINNNKLFCSTCNALIFEEISQEEFYSEKNLVHHSLDDKILDIIKLVKKDTLELLREN